MHIFICTTRLSSSDLNILQEIWIYYITSIEESFRNLSPIKNGTFLTNIFVLAMFNNIIVILQSSYDVRLNKCTYFVIIGQFMAVRCFR